MFESFRIICYLPLALFGIGWFISQLLYTRWKKPFTAMENWEQMQKTFLRSNSNILLMGILQITMLLLGIYMGRVARWFLLGVELVLILGPGDQWGLDTAHHAPAGVPAGLHDPLGAVDGLHLPDSGPCLRESQDHPHSGWPAPPL